MSNAFVSICLITYNHEKFIIEALEGIYAQVSKFPIEVVIGDDCSNDNTSYLIKDFISNKQLTNFYYHSRKKNLGMIGNWVTTIHECKGKYIALLEGDDYWTDPYKLQKQVDFLEANPDYVLCSANANVDNYSDEPFRKTYCGFVQDRSFTNEEILTEFYAPTLSILFRNWLIIFPDWFFNVMSGDTFLYLLLSEHGKFFYQNYVCGIYRHHNSGISYLNDKLLWHINTIYHLRLFKKGLIKNTKHFSQYIFHNQTLYLEDLLKEKKYFEGIKYFLKLEKVPFNYFKKNSKKLLIIFIKLLFRLK